MWIEGPKGGFTLPVEAWWSIVSRIRRRLPGNVIVLVRFIFHSSCRSKASAMLGGVGDCVSGDACSRLL